MDNFKSNLRILVVTRGLPFHGLGGMEAIAWDLSREFSRLGASVTILTTYTDVLPEKSNIEGVHIHCLQAAAGKYSRAWWRLTSQVYKDCYEGSVDVVLSVSAGAMAMCKSNVYSKTIFVVQAHGTSWGEFVSKLKQGTVYAALKSIRNIKGMLDDFGYRRFDSIVAVGSAVEYDLSHFPTRSIVGKLPVSVIENGVDAGAFSFDEDERARVRSLYGIDEKNKVIFSASRLHPQKGVLESLEAFASALKSENSLRFLIAGNGPDENRLKQRSVDLGVSHAVFFVGGIDRKEMGAYLSAADIFIFATKRVEVGVTMSLMEAQANGLPIIVSRHIANKQLVATEVDPDDRDSICEAILSVNRTMDRRSLLPEAFTLKYAAVRYLKLFKGMLDA